MTKLPRFQFSLSTLLLAVVWSAVVVWLNTTAGEVRMDDPNAPFGPGYRWLHYGWPLTYAWDVCRINVPPNGVHFAWYARSNGLSRDGLRPMSQSTREQPE